MTEVGSDAEYAAIVSEAERPDPHAGPPRPALVGLVAVILALASLSAFFVALEVASSAEAPPGRSWQDGPVAVEAEHAPGPLSTGQRVWVGVMVVDAVALGLGALLLFQGRIGWWLALTQGVLMLLLGLLALLSILVPAPEPGIPTALRGASLYVGALLAGGIILYVLARPDTLRHYGIGAPGSHVQFRHM